MRITDINIHKFGPIRDFVLEAAPVTVIFGDNESGKTTILDALLEALFSVSTRQVKSHFAGIDRYDGQGGLEGIVCIERRGIVLTYPSPTGDTLDRLAGFPPVYVRNLLVVRESDLQFYDKYGTWWLEIKDHLSGFEGGLEAVAEGVRQEIGLTREGDWINQKGRHIKDEVDALRETRQSFESLRQDAEELAQLRSRLKRLSLKREVAEKHLSLLKRAHAKEQLETASVLKRKFSDEQSRAAELLKYQDSAHAAWRNLETEIKTLQESLSNLKAQKNNLIVRINETEKEAALHEEQARSSARKEAQITPEVETGLQEIRAFYEKEKSLLAYQRFLFSGAILLPALAALFFVFAYFKDSAYLLPAFTCACGACACAGLWLRRRRLSRRLAEAKQALLARFHALGEQATDIDDIESWVFTTRRSTEQERASAEALSHEADKERTELTQLELGIEDKEKYLERRKLDLASMKEEYGCSSIDEFEARMTERTHAEDEVQSLAGKINILLGCATEEDWEEKLTELDQYEDVEILWEEETQARLENEVPLLSGEEKVARERSLAIEKRLLELGCNSPEDAWQTQEDAARRLRSFELDRRSAEMIFGILDELSEQQDTIINTVLESGSESATHYFRQATGGRYNNIFWRDSPDGEGGLFVQTPNGKTIGIESLSTGTRAQLQFSIRISLLSHLFGGEPLFLLLDDPFLTSDRERLHDLLKSLVDFTRQGWQIFYFTVDREIPPIFQELGQDSVVVKNLPRLDIST